MESETKVIAMIERVGIIGAGQMGSGIAHVCALAGIHVDLVDIDTAQLEGAIKVIEHNLDRQVMRGRIREDDKTAALSRIERGEDFAVFSESDWVIEAAT